MKRPFDYGVIAAVLVCACSAGREVGDDGGPAVDDTAPGDSDTWTDTDTEDGCEETALTRVTPPHGSADLYAAWSESGSGASAWAHDGVILHTECP